jgi:hypothetical protein
MAVGEGDGELFGIVENRSIFAVSAVEIDIVVSGTVHFRKF